MIIQILAAFLVTIFFSIMFNVNRKQLIYCGIVGAVGWFIYLLAGTLGFSPVAASFFVSLTVSILSHILAIYRKNPVTTYQIAGIIPVVPGAGMYQTLYYLTQDNLPVSNIYLVQTLQIAGAIAVGILFVSTTTQLIGKLRPQSPFMQ